MCVYVKTEKPNAIKYLQYLFKKNLLAQQTYFLKLKLYQVLSNGHGYFLIHEKMYNLLQVVGTLNNVTILIHIYNTYTDNK